MTKYWNIVAVLGFLAMTTSRAEGAVIVTSGGFSVSAPIDADVIGVARFDPALGSLDSVDVTIDGLLAVSVQTAPSFVNVGGTLVPVPYVYDVRVNQEFFGLGGQFFAFGTPAEFVFPPGLASGAGETDVLLTPFHYAFSFTAPTDLAGFSLATTFAPGAAALIPPVTVNGTRADFITDVVPDLGITFLQATSVVFGTVTPIAAVTNGALTIHYHYTPAAVPVPEPASLLLLGYGALACVRRTQDRLAARK